MTPSLHEKINRTIEILESEEHELISLAQISGYESFSFYNSANLSGLDLSRQDLRGLNFDGANMRGTSLENILYDPGAFNNTILDARNESLQDGYDLRLSNLMDQDLLRLYVFVEFRGSSVEKIIQATGATYGEVASDAKISIATLRKARQSQSMSLDTARTFAEYVHRLTHEPGYLRNDWSIVRQPIAKLLVSNQDGTFSKLPYAELEHLKELSNELLELRKTLYPSTYPVHRWRDKPTTIKSTINHLRPGTHRGPTQREFTRSPQLPGQIELDLEGDE
jgi:hypothetical protein